jgi:two-component system response regulator YesN
MYKIILIDDDTETLETIAGYYDWNELGMELVATADNGMSGLSVILDEKPDVVLIDIRMPGMDGLSVIAETHKQNLFPYFIVMSAHADFEYAQKALRLSVCEYLLKPYGPDELEKVFLRVTTELDKRIPELIMPQYGLPRAVDSALNYPVNIEKNIMELMFTGSRESLSPALDSFIAHIFERHDTNDALACVSMLYGAIVRPLIERGRSLSINPSAGIRWGDSDLCDSLRQFLLTVLDEIYAEIHAETTTNPAVLAAEKYIRTHYGDKLTLDVVAEASYITPTYLSSLFSKTLGTSFVSYVNNVRIERAQELLRDARADPNLVAEKVGFSDSKYFSQVFKRITGTTPNKYRNFMLERT